jgi:hypothetical protein
MGLEPLAVLGHPLSAKEQSSFAGMAGLDFGSLCCAWHNIQPKSDRKMMDVGLWPTSFLH